MQQYMYLKQLDWCRWAAYDEMTKARALAPEPSRPVTPPESEKPLPPVPPVTPSRHVAAGTAATAALAPPGQPRKTPTAKRVAADPVDSDEEASLTARRRPPNKHARTESAACVRDTAPSRLARPATRAAVGSTARKPVPSTAVKPSPYKLAAVPPASALNAPSTAAQRRIPRRAESPTPTPSRLPQLSTKRAAAITPLPGAISGKGRKKMEKPDAWIASGSPAQDRAKLGRPILRGMRRRRSSFSAADVVA